MKYLNLLIVALDLLLWVLAIASAYGLSTLTRRLVSG